MDPLFVFATLAYGLFCFGYELWRASRGETVITEQVKGFVLRWPPFLFLVGVLCGHLFT